MQSTDTATNYLQTTTSNRTNSLLKTRVLMRLKCSLKVGESITPPALVVNSSGGNTCQSFIVCELIADVFFSSLSGEGQEAYEEKHADGGSFYANAFVSTLSKLQSEKELSAVFEDVRNSKYPLLIPFIVGCVSTLAMK